MNDIDRELDASWRAASREQPPAALDDAIRAAARREVRARPGRMRAAPRWLPLAAAATIAAIAVGVVQMMPPEQVTPSAIPPANEPLRDVKPDADKSMASGLQPETQIAANTSGGQPRRGAETPASEAPRAAPASSRGPEVARDTAKPLAKEQRTGLADEVDRGKVVGRSESFAGAPPDQLQEKKTLASRQSEAQRKDEGSNRSQTSKQKTELAATSVARPNPASPNSPAESMAGSAIQPFPAAPPAAESRIGNTAPTIAAAAPASAPDTALAARKLAMQSSATGAVTSNRAADAAPALAQDAAAPGKPAAIEQDKDARERRKDSAPLAPEEWIKRIRRLIAEGRNDDAAKELAAFRREYKDRSDALLPSDLRSFRP